MVNSKLKELIKSGTFVGILLIIAFTLAITVSNTSLRVNYVCAKESA